MQVFRREHLFSGLKTGVFFRYILESPLYIYIEESYYPCSENKCAVQLLICAFGFAYDECCFSDAAAQSSVSFYDILNVIVTELCRLSVENSRMLCKIKLNRLDDYLFCEDFLEITKNVYVSTLKHVELKFDVELFRLIVNTIEPSRGKTNNVVSDQVRHKLICTSTEKS